MQTDEMALLQPSCRSNYRRNPEATYEAFAAFCGDLAAVGRCSLLLVSGSQRKKLDTVAVSVCTGAKLWWWGRRTGSYCNASRPANRCSPAANHASITSSLFA